MAACFGMDCRLVVVVWMFWSGYLAALTGADDDNDHCYNHCHQHHGHHPSIASCVLGPNASWDCHDDEFCEVTVSHQHLSLKCRHVNHHLQECEDRKQANAAGCDHQSPGDECSYTYCCLGHNCVLDLLLTPLVSTTSHTAVAAPRMDSCFTTACNNHDDLATCIHGRWACEHDEFCSIEIHGNGAVHMRCQEARLHELQQCELKQSHNHDSCHPLILPPFNNCQYCCRDVECLHRVAHITTTTTTTTATTTAAVPDSTTDIPDTTTPQPTTTTLKQTTTHQGVPTSCAVCDAMCILSQQDQPCPSGFCMTSITDDESFSRVVKKSCVAEDECYKRWWQETSDRPLCLSILSESSGPTGVATSCNYCCHGDRCNSPDFPSRDTLYDGNNKGHYPVG